MVRHDVTFGVISSYRFSLFTARDRDSQTLYVSLPIAFNGKPPSVRQAMAGSIFVSFLDRAWREATEGWRDWDDPGKNVRSKKTPSAGGKGGSSAGGACGGKGGDGGGDGKGSKAGRKNKDGGGSGRGTKKIKTGQGSRGGQDSANLCDDALYQLHMGFPNEKPIGRVLTNFGMAFHWGALHSTSYSVMLAGGPDDDLLGTPSLSPSITSTTSSSPVRTPDALPSPRAAHHHWPESSKPLFDHGNLEGLTLDATAPPPCHRAQILARGLEGTATLTAILGSGGFATVWGGNLALRGLSLAKVNVAVKIPHQCAEAEGSVLHEAKIYASLQSKAAPIPRYWGLFHELCCDGQRGGPVLVLENAGVPLKSFSDPALPRWLEYFIFQAFRRLHLLGVEHNDIRPENIVLDPVSCVPSIIDFGMAALGHNCVVGKCSELQQLRHALGMTGDEWSAWVANPLFS
ncbi:hypothetical protein BOTBODRAFT_49678 [Botryobasidium botryosum FD-172 SS1]|uniref:Protein kinase domain-containing protein n=1 Tax=Botryobasidium botryosum (strain FD-172 SS1) TaxID=930990 RepID=A0A067M1Y4_BOTB1|nr:hypothetical protein BOTBODRAFT_49678 [Botryobasidium botryosum FD-172 SS1]